MFLKKITLLMIVLFILCSTFVTIAEEGNIIFVSQRNDTYIDPFLGDYADGPYYYILEGMGYTIHHFYNTSLSTADQASIDSLNNADLVILGRSPSSTIFQDPNKETWNSITTPIMNLSLWSVRSSRLNWFNSTASENWNDEVDYFAYAMQPDDPVFEGVDTSQPIYWARGPVSVLVTKEAGNGTVLASLFSETEADSSVLYVRFEPNVEFYEGSVDMPADHRVMIGNANDNVRDSNDNIVFNYYNWSEESEKVYTAEVSRLVELGKGTPVEKNNSVKPSNYALIQNYPNPFNPTTQIDFSLSESGYTTVQVFNIAGQLVNTLIDGAMSAGVHSIQFDASNLPAGVYFYSIECNGFTSMKKMTLLK